MAGKYPFKLYFKKTAIRECAGPYPVDYNAEIETGIAPQVKAREYDTYAMPVHIRFSIFEPRGRLPVPS